MTDKNVIVFGGSGSVGRAVCAALTADGARVAFTYYRNESAATELLAALPGSVARPVVKVMKIGRNSASNFSRTEARPCVSA